MESCSIGSRLFQHEVDTEMEKDEAEMDFDGSNSSFCIPDSLKASISARGINLQMLIADGIIEPGPGLMSIKYLGRKFHGDLLATGRIKMSDSKETFSSPSAWAMYCKRQVNPDKRSGSGWGSVYYKGKKLEMWKTMWIRKHRPLSPAISRDTMSPRSVASELNANGEQNGRILMPNSSLENTSYLTGPFNPDPAPLDLTPKAAHTGTAVVNSNKSMHRPSIEEFDGSFQEEALNLCLKDPSSSTESKIKSESNNNNSNNNNNNNNNCIEKISIKHSSLKTRSQNIDPNTFVQCETFECLRKIQPFTVSIATNSMLLMDFHCHLTSSEVVGYLGGKWDPKTEHLSIIQAYPCQCRLADATRAMVVEEEIKQKMHRAGLTVVGWYHSHPFSQPDPSVKDIDCQMSYQLRMKGSGSTYFPCVGIIVSPFNKKSLKTDSRFRMFMVMPPPESDPSDYGVPVTVRYAQRQNPSVTEELLAEMKNAADFYRNAPDWMKFRQSWKPSVSYLDKLKASLGNKLPEDQMEKGTFLDFVHHILNPVTK